MKSYEDTVRENESLKHGIKNLKVALIYSNNVIEQLLNESNIDSLDELKLAFKKSKEIKTKLNVMNNHADSEDSWYEMKHEFVKCTPIEYLYKSNEADSDKVIGHNIYSGFDNHYVGFVPIEKPIIVSEGKLVNQEPERANVGDTIKLNLDLLATFEVTPSFVFVLGDKPYIVLSVENDHVIINDEAGHSWNVFHKWYIVVKRAEKPAVRDAINTSKESELHENDCEESDKLIHLSDKEYRDAIDLAQQDAVAEFMCNLSKSDLIEILKNHDEALGLYVAENHQYTVLSGNKKSFGERIEVDKRSLNDGPAMIFIIKETIEGYKQSISNEKPKNKPSTTDWTVNLNAELSPSLARDEACMACGKHLANVFYYSGIRLCQNCINKEASFTTAELVEMLSKKNGVNVQDVYYGATCTLRVNCYEDPTVDVRYDPNFSNSDRKAWRILAVRGDFK